MAETFHTINESLQYWAQNDGDKEALIFLNKHGRHSSISRADVFKAAGRFATRLRRNGFQHGDIIANSITNSPERIVTDFGILLAGCVTVNCQAMEKDGTDFWHLAEKTSCSAVILTAKDNNPAYLLLSQFLNCASGSHPKSGFYDVSIPKAPSVKKIAVANRVDTKSDDSEQAEKPAPYSDFISDLLASDEEVFVEDVEESDLCYIFLTSGSTGFGKLVPRTHREVIITSRDLIQEKYSKHITDRPFGWTGGFPLLYFVKGFTLYNQDWYDGDQAKTPRDIWTLYDREQVTGASLSTTQVKDFLQEFRNDPPSFKLKYIGIAGQTISKKVDEAIGLLSDSLILGYGSTETVMVSGFLATQADQVQDYLSGKAIKNILIKILDDDLKELPCGQDGRIVVKSPYVFSNYFNTTPAQPIFTPDGYFITGDRGKLDEDGNLFVYGREGEVISRGAILIYLNWPESVLESCPGVQAVVIVPVTGFDGEDKMCACVIKQDGADLDEEKLREYYKNKFASSYSSQDNLLPVIDFVLFYDVFPSTYTSKINKIQLKKDAKKRFCRH